MEGDVLIFAQVMAILVPSCAALAGILLGARVLWRHGSEPRRDAALPPNRRDFARLETAVEAMAIEVERISESQRYLVSVLADRLPGRTDAGGKELPAPGAGRRSITPH